MKTACKNERKKKQPLRPGAPSIHRWTVGEGKEAEKGRSVS